MEERSLGGTVVRSIGRGEDDPCLYEQSPCKRRRITSDCQPQAIPTPLARGSPTLRLLRSKRMASSRMTGGARSPSLAPGVRTSPLTPACHPPVPKSDLFGSKDWGITISTGEKTEGGQRGARNLTLTPPGARSSSLTPSCPPPPSSTLPSLLTPTIGSARLATTTTTAQRWTGWPGSSVSPGRSSVAPPTSTTCPQRHSGQWLLSQVNSRASSTSTQPPVWPPLLPFWNASSSGTSSSSERSSGIEKDWLDIDKKKEKERLAKAETKVKKAVEKIEEEERKAAEEPANIKKKEDEESPVRPEESLWPASEVRQEEPYLLGGWPEARWELVSPTHIHLDLGADVQAQPSSIVTSGGQTGKQVGGRKLE